MEGDFSFGTEFNRAVFESKESVIFAQPDVWAGEYRRPALANDDIARPGTLPVGQLGSEVLGIRIS